MATYKIPAGNMSKLEAGVKLLNRKAKKLKQPEISFKKISSERVSYWVDMCEYTKTICTVEIEGVSPVIDGWKFLAKIEHTDGGNIISALPEAPEVCETYRTVASDCHHCKTKRARKFTYMVQEMATDKILQVGKSCLKDFTGHKSVERLALLATFEEMIGGCASEDMDPYERDDRRAMRVPKSYDVIDVLATAAAVLEKFSYQGKNEYNYETTRERVERQFNPGSETVVLRIEGKHLEAANEYFNFVTASTDNSQYFHNLRVTCKKDFVMQKDFGLIVSIIPAFHKAKDLELKLAGKKAAAALSSFQGTVGKRENFRLKVEKVYHFEGEWGMTHINRMIDAAGNIFVWKSGSRPLDEGAEYILKGTVKSHDVYRDANQTTLSRCVVVEEIAPVALEAAPAV